VLSSAIDKYIFVTIKKRFDQKIRVGYTRAEMVDSVDEIQHDLMREAHAEYADEDTQVERMARVRKRLRLKRRIKAEAPTASRCSGWTAT
jgi:galactokinase/mevalonate kinase-like predicted kinase